MLQHVQAVQLSGDMVYGRKAENFSETVYKANMPSIKGEISSVIACPRVCVVCAGDGDQLLGGINAFVTALVPLFGKAAGNGAIAAAEVEDRCLWLNLLQNTLHTWLNTLAGGGKITGEL